MDLSGYELFIFGQIFNHARGRGFGHILPLRGIRQGNPLSHCLFILYAEGLYNLIRYYEMNKLIHGCNVVNEAPIIFHKFFLQIIATYIAGPPLISLLKFWSC